MNQEANTIKINQIRIKESFKKTKPSAKKIEEKLAIYRETGEYRPILLERNNYLADGYATYIMLKSELGYEGSIRYKYKEQEEDEYKNEATLYIYGTHPNPKIKRAQEYVFRVKDNLIDYVDIETGEYVLVDTKFGYAPLCITKTEVLDRSPVAYEVKKVIKRIRNYRDNHKEGKK